MATPLMLKTVRDEEFDQEKNAKIKWLIWLQTDVHEIYTIKYLHIYIFSLTFMLFYDWLYNIFVLQVTRALHAKWG